MVNDQKEVMDEKKPIEEKVEKKAQVVEDNVEKKVEVKTEDVEKEIETAKEETKEKIEKIIPEEKDEKQKEQDYMMNLLDEHFSKFEEGKIVEGRVVSVDERNVLVDIGFKSESAISVREFNTSSIPKIGDKISVYIDSVEDVAGRLKLSKKKADFTLNIDKLEKLQEANETIRGIFKRRVKGGMIVEILGIEAFLPGSHISTKPIPNLDQFIGKENDFQILKIDRERRNVIISRKKVLIEEQESRLEDLRDKIIIGAELDGEVRNITDYGAFIDMGGIDGLLHITDMSWGHIKHPSDMLNIGNKVKVKILDYNEEEQKVSLGLKQLVPHPWENIEAKYPEGSIISGKVVNLTNYGAFVELEPGVEGLVHISELSWTKKIKHPKQILKVGDNVKAIILTTSKDDKRISLGIKQMEANPWITIEQRYPIDTILKGVVKTLTPFGVFIEIEEDIEGLVHISDISWTKRIYHPKEVLDKGQEVKVKILSIDKTLHRIALGIKQIENDPWENLDEKLPINTELTAKIVKIISKGVLVDVIVDNYIVEGFVPLSHLAIPGLKKAGMAFQKDEDIPLKIIELDLENRRLILSVKAYFFAKDEVELQEFVKIHLDRVQQKQAKRMEIKEIISQTPEKEEIVEPETAKTELENEEIPEDTAIVEKAVEEVVVATDVVEQETELPVADTPELEDTSQEEAVIPEVVETVEKEKVIVGQEVPEKTKIVDVEIEEEVSEESVDDTDNTDTAEDEDK